MTEKSDQTFVTECNAGDSLSAFLNGLTNGFDTEIKEHKQNIT